MTKIFKLLPLVLIHLGIVLASDDVPYFFYREHPYFNLDQFIRRDQCDAISPLEFKSKKGHFGFRQNSGLFYRDGAVVAEFDFPVLTRNDKVYVSLDGILKTRGYWSIHPSTSELRWQYTKTIKTILIDPGHGGKDFGTYQSGRVAEKDVNLRISKILAELLSKAGYQVRLTRYSDIFLTKSERVMKASLHQSDLFISMHANSSHFTSARGMEAFFLKTIDHNDKVNEWIHTFPEPGIIHKYIQKDFEEHMQLLKNSMATHLKMIPETKYRGNKYGKFYVLRNIFCPSILIEIGFMSNPQEHKLLSSYSHLYRISEKIVDGVNEYASRIAKR